MPKSTTLLAPSDRQVVDASPRVVVMGDGDVASACARRLAELGCRVQRIDLIDKGDDLGSVAMDAAPDCDMAVLAVEGSGGALFDTACRLTAKAARSRMSPAPLDPPVEYASFAPSRPIQEERVAPWSDDLAPPA